jgi:UDP-3-O-[3-hydroxymyristoyl] N-acetylglucosamine deacetylase
VEDKGKRISILPDDAFRLTCDTDYPAPIGRQSLELEVTPERYAAEIAFARTFGWEANLNQMRDMGLIRGASLENAVCFTAAGALNPEGTWRCWAARCWAT